MALSLFEACSLRVKILGLLFIVLALAIGATLFGLWNYQRSELIKVSLHNAREMGLTIDASLRDAMLRKDRGTIQTIIDQIGAIEHLHRISVVNTENTIVMSTMSELSGTVLDQNKDKSCLGCHASAEVQSNFGIRLDGAAGPFLRSIIKINNSEDCHACHSSEQKNNGMLVIDSSLLYIDKLLSSITIKIILTGIVAFLILAWLISLIINRLVSDPVEAFMKGIRQVEQGDYDSWVEVKDTGEFSEIAISFNVIKKAVGRYIKKMRSQNEEIATLYTIVQRMSETIEIKKVKSTIVNLILELFQAEDVLLVVIARENQEINFELNSRHKDGDYSQSLYYPEIDGDPHSLLSSEELLEWHHSAGDQKPLFPVDQSRALIPLYLEDMNLGLLVIEKSDHKTFCAAEKKIIPTLTHHIVISLANAHLYNIAITDELTGLYTKRYFQTKLKELENTSRMTSQIFSLLMLDVDYFKAINDTYGHPIGDFVLHDVAELIRSNLRLGDIPCRYGGEEFVVILPNSNINAAQKIGQRLLSDVEEHVFSYDSLAQDIKLTISIGVACFPGNGSNREELVVSADSALYKAKQSGRNQLCVAAPDNSPSPTMPASS